MTFEEFKEHPVYGSLWALFCLVTMPIWYPLLVIYGTVRAIIDSLRA